MSKSQKELAFLRDLTITKDWTERFTEFVDKHFDKPKKGKMLYVNAGTLSHALELREKLKKDVELTCVCEDLATQKIAEAKALVIKSPIKFARLDKIESETFDVVIADLTFARPDTLAETLDEIMFRTKKGGKVSFYLPSAGSFGEIFSFLWETFIGIDLIERSAEIERLLGEVLTISKIEEIAEKAGMRDILHETTREVFDYETGKEFVDSSLISDFLIPRWLDFLSEKEQKQARKKLAQIIDTEHDRLSFQFSVKATLISGTKA